MLASAVMVAGIVAVVLALLPLFPVTQVVGLLLGAGAGGVGYLLRKQQIRRAQPTTAASVAIGCGLAALVLSGLLLVSCHACSGDGETDERIEQQFRQSLDRALEQAREKILDPAK